MKTEPTEPTIKDALRGIRKKPVMLLQIPLLFAWYVIGYVVNVMAVPKTIYDWLCGLHRPPQMTVEDDTTSGSI